jgi:uncharacterized protein
MKLSNVEKLTLLMLCDIADGKKEIDVAFIREAIFSDNTWSIEWKMSGLDFEKDPEPKHVTETVEILSMFRALTFSYKDLSDDDKARVDASKSAHNLTYKGFDGNNETEHLNAASFLINSLDRFMELKGKGDLNSHSQVLDKYLRMVAVRRSFGSIDLNADQIIQVIEA